MLLDISEIVKKKIEEMEQDGTIQKKIEDGIEETINRAIESAVSDWNLRKCIENQVYEAINPAVKNIGLSAYTKFLNEKVNSLLKDKFNNDLAEIISNKFTSVYTADYSHITKVSQIVEEYRKYLADELDVDDLEYTGAQFHVSVENKISDEVFSWWTINLSCEATCEKQIKIKILKYRNKGTENISYIYLDGEDVNDLKSLNGLNSFECMLVNLLYNETKLVLDFDEIDEDDNYIFN